MDEVGTERLIVGRDGCHEGASVGADQIDCDPARREAAGQGFAADLAVERRSSAVAVVAAPGRVAEQRHRACDEAVALVVQHGDAAAAQQRRDRTQQHVVSGAPAGRSVGILVDQHGSADGRGLRAVDQRLQVGRNAAREHDHLDRVHEPVLLQELFERNADLAVEGGLAGDRLLHRVAERRVGERDLERHDVRGGNVARVAVVVSDRDRDGARPVHDDQQLGMRSWLRSLFGGCGAALQREQRGEEELHRT